jgi:hypothetical protein
MSESRANCHSNHRRQPAAVIVMTDCILCWVHAEAEETVVTTAMGVFSVGVRAEAEETVEHQRIEQHRTALR